MYLYKDTAEDKNDDQAFSFQQFPANYSMQMCNTVTNGGMPGTAINNQIVNTNNSSLTSANGGLTVDSIKSTNFSINEDSNGIRDATKKSARDPLSHRIIEKRRRDRMNKCLNDLSRLIPQHYIKKGRGRIEKTEIVEMAIKYINHLRENGKSLPFSGQLMESNKINSLSSFSSINLNHFKEESEHSDPSLQNSLQNSINKQHFNESDDYLNGFRDCFSEAIKFLTTTTVLQQQIQPTKERSSEQLIVDLRNYLDAVLMNHKQQEISSLGGKQRKMMPDFSSKSNASIQSVDGLQIKLEEMDVEESSSRSRKQEKLNDEIDKFAISFSARNLPIPTKSVGVLNLSANKCQPTNNALKNYLTINDQLKADYPKSNCFANSDLNPSSIKSRSLTSSPNSSTLDYSAYKFKSSIREKFDAEFNSKMCKSEHGASAISRPRSATVGANASSLRRLNNATLELKEKLGNSTAGLNGTNSLENDRIVENKLFECRPLEKPLESKPNLNLGGSQQLASNLSKSTDQSIKRTSPGFVLHPLASYYIPCEIDLTNLLTHFKPMNSFKTNQENLLSNLENKIQNIQHLSTGANKSHQQLNLHHPNSLPTGSQSTSNQSFQDHLSYSSPSLNSINNSSLSNYLHNSSIKYCLDDKFGEQDSVLYPISISVSNLKKFPPLSLNAILNSQKSS